MKNQAVPNTNTVVRRVISPEAFGEAIDTSAARVRQYIKEGRIKAVRHGRRIVIPISEIDAFLEREAQGGQR